jgi:hypothetical protein
VSDKQDFGRIFPGIAFPLDFDESCIGHDMGICHQSFAFNDKSRPASTHRRAGLPGLAEVRLLDRDKDFHDRAALRINSRQGSSGEQHGGQDEKKGHEMVSGKTCLAHDSPHSGFRIPVFEFSMVNYHQAL